METIKKYLQLTIILAVALTSINAQDNNQLDTLNDLKIEKLNQEISNQKYIIDSLEKVVILKTEEIQIQKKLVEEQKKIAEEQKQKAIEQQKIAEEQYSESVKQKKIAELQREEAERQLEIAVEQQMKVVELTEKLDKCQKSNGND